MSTDRCERNQEQTTKGSGVDRRTFIAAASASLVAQWLAEFPKPAWAEGGTVPMMPGYLRGSEAVVNSRAAMNRLSHGGYPFFEVIRDAIPAELPLEFVSAAGVGGDELPPGEIRVTVHGLLPPDLIRLDDLVHSVQLEVETVLEETGDRHTFLAWTYEQAPVANLAGPTSFILPVGPGVSMNMKLRLNRFSRGEKSPNSIVSGLVETDIGGDSVQEFVAEMACRDRFLRPRLRAGTYALPLSTEAVTSFPLPANREWLVPRYLLFLMFSVEAL